SQATHFRPRVKHATAGTMKDATPEGVLESPIQNRADFEHLEMKGLQAGYGVVTGKIADYLAKLKRET
ncbi:MAG: hypothetical protein ACLP9L_26090, partial [Thermoguttaceae bacterium]